MDIWYSGLRESCLLQDWSWRRLYGSQASQVDHSILTACSILSPSQPPYPPRMEFVHLESKMAKVSHQFHRGVGHCRRKGLVQMAFGVEKRFFAVHVVRHSRLLRRRGLVMDGTLNDMQMYSKVILLPTQSPHVCVCCARRPPRFLLALTR